MGLWRCVEATTSTSTGTNISSKKLVSGTEPREHLRKKLRASRALEHAAYLEYHFCPRTYFIWKCKVWKKKCEKAAISFMTKN